MLEELRSYLRRGQKVNLIIVAVNVLVFIAAELFGSTQDPDYMIRCGAMYLPLVREGEYYRLFTSMFLHFGLNHLVYNMICLLGLGDLLASMIGAVRYLFVYLTAGLAGNLLSAALERGGGYKVSAGASGAIFGVIGALLAIHLVLWLQNRRKEERSAPIRRDFMVRLLLMSALMLGQGFLEQGTDNAAHVGGFAAGFVLGLLAARYVRRRLRPMR